MRCGVTIKNSKGRLLHPTLEKPSCPTGEFDSPDLDSQITSVYMIHDTTMNMEMVLVLYVVMRWLFDRNVYVPAHYKMLLSSSVSVQHYDFVRQELRRIWLALRGI